MAKTPNRRTPTRPPLLRSLPAFPKGPRLYQVPKSDLQSTGGPGHPPAGFITATNSVSEWWLYWGLWKALRLPGDPRKGPFVGHPPEFTYQSPFSGGRQIKGGAVIDYLVEPNRYSTDKIAIRLQTEYFHNASFGNNKFMQDLMQEQYISSAYTVVDVQELTFLGDPTGQAVVQVAKRALSGQTQADPVAGGYPSVVQNRPT